MEPQGRHAGTMSNAPRNLHGKAPKQETQTSMTKPQDLLTPPPRMPKHSVRTDTLHARWPLSRPALPAVGLLEAGGGKIMPK